MKFGDNTQLALDTIMMRKTDGIPTALLHIMDTELLEELGGHQVGEYF